MRRLMFLAAALIAILALVLLLKPTGEPSKPTERYILLDENLEPMVELNHLPDEWNGLLLVGRTKKGYVYAPKETVYSPQFVDRLLLLEGIEENVGIPVTWWMEKNGARIEPVKGRASSSFLLVVRTPYEIIESRVPVVGLYTGRWYLGKAVEANGDCIWVERWEDVNVPVLLRRSGVVDPEARLVCRPRCEEVNVTVLDGAGNPVTGWFTLGRDGNYGYFFGEFNGGFRACKCDDVRIRASGFAPWGGRICEDTIVVLRRVREGVELSGDVHLDILGALAGTGRITVGPGAYRTFSVFPLREENRGLPVVEAGGWLGYKRVERVPVYSFLLEENYLYITKEGPLDPTGYLLCSEGRCLPVEGNGTSVLCFGNQTLYWDGVLHGKNCLKVKA